MPHIYYLRNLQSDLTNLGSAGNYQATEEAGTAAGQTEITLGGGASGTKAWYTPAGNPDETTWPSGQYVVNIPVVDTGADITYSFSLLRINASGAIQETLATSQNFSGSGLRTWTPTVGEITAAASDRIALRMNASRSASHGNQRVNVEVNTSDSYFETPIIHAFPNDAEGTLDRTLPALISSKVAEVEQAPPPEYEAVVSRTLPALISEKTTEFTTSSLVLNTYRWRNDDGSESEATWSAQEQNSIVQPVESKARLRVSIDRTGGATIQDVTIQFRQKDSEDQWEDIR